MLESLFARFLIVLSLFVPALAFAQGRAVGGYRFAWVWVIGLAMAVLFGVALWSWTRMRHPPRKLGP